MSGPSMPSMTTGPSRPGGEERGTSALRSSADTPVTRALSGVLLILLGAWGGLIPFIGPYFHYAYTPSSAWSYTSGRLWLEILPAAGAVAGGLILLASASRPAALLGAWLAAISGAWFAVGGLIGPIWRGHEVSAGTPVGGAIIRSLEQIGFFTGLGLAVAFVAAVALGRLTVIAVKDT
jgi:hypothetical protein